jgi:hypothetical protein
MQSEIIFSAYLEPFRELEPLRQSVLKVLMQLPELILQDFLADPQFRVSLDEFEPGKGRTVLMPELGPDGTSRCVVLKPKLAFSPEPFALYIIAHEFAHAYLRNGGWGTITDREEAADALAETWGFARVEYPWRFGW